MVIHNWIPGDVEDLLLVGLYQVELLYPSFYKLVDMDVSSGCYCELGLVEWIPCGAVDSDIVLDFLDDF